MRVYVDSIGNHPLAGTVEDLGTKHASRHQIVGSPDEADLILLCGSFSRDPHLLTRHPLYRRSPQKCAVYTGDDRYFALAPGVYTSPRRGLSTRIGRVRSHAFAASYGRHANQAVREATRSPDAWREHDKTLLFSFEGSATSRLRRRLFALRFDQRITRLDDTTRTYSHFDHDGEGRAAGQARYVDTMLSSRFALCPRGVGTGTLRLFESMSLGVAPVLLSDHYVLPRGPDWETFLFRLPERRVPHLESSLRAFTDTAVDRGLRARSAWETWFAPEVLFDHLVDAAFDTVRAAPAVEALCRRVQPVLVAYLALRGRILQIVGSLLRVVRARLGR